VTIPTDVVEQNVASTSEMKNKSSKKSRLFLDPEDGKIFSSETSLNGVKSPEDMILHNHQCQNFKSYSTKFDLK
jgi:hypothetical protein